MVTLKVLVTLSVKVRADDVPDLDSVANQHQYSFWGQTLLLGGYTEPSKLFNL